MKQCNICRDTGKVEVICRPLDEEIPQYVPCKECEKGRALLRKFQPDWRKQVRKKAIA